MYLRMKNLPGGLRGKTPKERDYSSAPPVPKKTRPVNTVKPPSDQGSKNAEKALLRAITSRQEQRWEEVLNEYRAEKNLMKGPQ